MSRFISSRYSHIEPYTPGEQPKVKGRLIKLNTNENPYPPAPGVLKILNSKEAEDLRLYPDPEATELVKEIASFYGIGEDEVMVSNGSDEVLAFIFMAFQNEERRMVFPAVSYSFYPVYCSLYGAEAVKVPLAEDYRVEPEDYFSAGGTIIITNPNAPTGRALTLSEIEEILVSNRDDLVVIDEAYVDFGADSAVSLIDRYDNLLVVQTFSKSRSLAGARIGFAMGDREIIEDLNRIKFSFNPYNLNRLSIKAGAAAMRDKAYFEDISTRIAETRDRFSDEMRNLGFDVIPSKSNFVFVSSPDIPGEAYFTELRKYNIIVRYFNDPAISDRVRITIGTPEEMDILLFATKEILERYSGGKI